MPGLCRLNYGTSTENPSLGVGIISAVVAVVTLPLAVQGASFTTGVPAGHHSDAGLLQRMGDELMDIKVL